MKVIDIFAGPGGLAEGFNAIYDQSGKRVFDIALSIEKAKDAFNTLKLRTFFREFSNKNIPDAYYAFLKGEMKYENLLAEFPREANSAAFKTWQATLGDKDKFPHKEIDKKIGDALDGSSDWILIGGPPCQAYSLVGRARNQWTADHQPDDEHPYYHLYKEYIRIISKHDPCAFVMENVPGLFSVVGSNGPLFNHILKRLRNPSRTQHYQLFSMANGLWQPGNPVQEFLIKAELYGIPQARHRIIVFGIREDLIQKDFSPLSPSAEYTPLRDVIGGLPRLRSGLSQGPDSLSAWQAAITSIQKEPWFCSFKDNFPKESGLMLEAIKSVEQSELNRGSEFVEADADQPALADWYIDKRLQGQCNHSTRGHLVSDLWRYLLSACYTLANGRSPRLEEYPVELLPAHKNALHGKFNDRFRVQYADHPAKTLTSHIAHDGHYYIHFDPSQCRSLTVREAARIQTFPDNYFFCGGRTSQYEQVGNAVPPYLAKIIAEKVLEMLQ